MKSLFFCLFVALGIGRLCAQTAAHADWQPAAGYMQIPIWSGTAPDALPMAGPESKSTRKDSAGKPWASVTNVSIPTMTVYSPKGVNTGVAMVVFPGGGFSVLAMDLEGTEICDWLNSIGITAVLSKYRVPSKEKGPYGESKLGLEDAQRTVGLVRLHAAEWHIDPHKIGVIGFSAGGYLVAALSNRYDKREYTPVDGADKQSCRPDFAIACYPGHLRDGGDDMDLNPDIRPTAKTPPTFLLQAEDDHVDGVEQTLVYFEGLKKANAPVEMHLYTKGGHGFGLRASGLPISEWPQLVEKWLGTIGITGTK